VNVLMILNDPPYGTERSYNGLRLARELSKNDDVRLRLFLMADAVGCGKDGQTTPNGYYNVARMVRSVARKGADVGAAARRRSARGLSDAELLDGVHRSTMDELGTWTVEADKVIVF